MPIGKLLSDLLRDAEVGSRSSLPKYILAAASTLLGMGILVFYLFIEPGQSEHTSPHNRMAALWVGGMFVTAGVLMVIITRRSRLS